MRAHPDARDAWAIFKRELARIAESTQDYVEVKDPATDVVMVVAERWAADSGWSTHVAP
jgi:dephospho-CoA kinase